MILLPADRPGAITWCDMRRLFLVVVVALIAVAVFTVLAPQAPDGSWIKDAGEKISEGLKAFWGNPIAP
jgi:hypothetical protein